MERPCGQDAGLTQLRAWKALRLLWHTGEHRQASEVLVACMLQRSKGANEAKIRTGARFNRDGTLQQWSLDHCSLDALPEEFGTVCTTGTLNLYSNRLTSLPESFGGVTVGGDLVLSRNRLTCLPESFGALTVGEGLWLERNELASLPEGLVTVTVGGWLDLSGNRLNLKGKVCFPNVKGKLRLSEKKK
eukprot:TRINITY_DN1252_c0_g1_i1.p1 TRINITY_DN1252_c0_g1~~TRINITY_DN1252_c0_g1_i1.p1  ORF type:complete len:189 (+),score=29.07 TRINITY_DN1252_c0_g1_i1:254-820(+)